MEDLTAALARNIVDGNIKNVGIFSRVKTSQVNWVGVWIGFCFGLFVKWDCGGLCVVVL